jgi:hypothetical protein
VSGGLPRDVVTAFVVDSRRPATMLAALRAPGERGEVFRRSPSTRRFRPGCTREDGGEACPRARMAATAGTRPTTHALSTTFRNSR